MAGDTITPEVLADRIAALSRDQREDLDDIKRLLDKVVSREVYDAHRKAAESQLADLKRRVEILEGRARWAVAFIVMPILVIVVQYWLNTHGAKP